MGATASFNAAARDDLIIQRFSRYQVILPLITAAGSLLGALFGGIYTVHRSQLSQQDQQMTEWRGALERVKFDQDSLITSAYLLESYEGTDHDEPARKLQISMLKSATKPETFDMIFQNMLSDAARNKTDKGQDVVTDLLDVDRTLTARLQTLWTNASRNLNLPPDQAKSYYEAFLQNPTQFFGASQQTDLNRTLILIWELDTFSNGMDCIWNSKNNAKNKECPHLSAGLPDAKDMLLLNHKAPNFKTIMTTCSVQHSVGEDQYECD